jgi:pilus assembly protein Flp/PilA
MKKMINWFKNEESGQGMVEYALIIALIAIVVIAGLAILGPKIRDMFVKIGNNL